MLLLASPILAAAAVAVWLESGLPILFRQERVGLQFKRFRILKFRTMRVQDGGPLVTVRGDNRITTVGKVLRLMKIDEFPQFWNVLRGDMSVVGPRPEVPKYVEMFKERYQRILVVRPGITDLASVYFRDEEEILARSEDPLHEYREHILPLKLDLADKYLKERTCLRDAVIIMRTAAITLSISPPSNRG
jgi:lipopolysaccharide/colanic/teichoic acid biosynthesis glycosyltransferase